ncbi:MAG: leucine--tRNA ligase [Eubacteriales bacterium]
MENFKVDLLAVEKKWQKKWDETQIYKFDRNNMENKQYILEMFSYPSGANLHIGHWYNYGLTDTYARFVRMSGKNVFHPMGFDAFGLPAENYAIKTGIHPYDSTIKNIETMERQLKEMGATFNWDYEIKTCMPDYYRWTQWFFLKLYEKGLAYRKKSPVNWCPKCNTVLANEQVQDGGCERCGTTVIRKNLTQWFFKITDYADRLLEGLNKIDWPEKTKLMQRNWIGKSVGAQVKFKIVGGGDFTVFTTRVDTLFGCTYVVLAPENELVDKITTDECRDAVNKYIDDAAKATEIDRLSTTREKTGVFTGSYAINPINGRKVPIWIADYVLNTYGTGCVMAVPAHDERDFEFATKYGLPIERVIKAKEPDEDDTLPYVGYGVLVNSGELDGQTVEKAKEEMIKLLQKTGSGEAKINYRLRDWLISRQRYWGAPIPIVYCEKCGEVPIPEDQLPVTLPYDVDFSPHGDSPLLKHEGFMNTTCPICGGKAKRDPDTMDTFVCSSWYFLRYPDNKNDKMAFNPEIINKMLPVDVYVGGVEHACMHLLYARFFTKAFYDMGYLNFEEPFLRLIHQGVILGPDGEKMSKSRGNVISPDKYISQYGSDVLRMYLGFGFSYIEGGPWNDDGIKAINRFLERVERFVVRFKDLRPAEKPYTKEDKELNYVLNYAIKKVSEDIETFSFNTAIARIMELVNSMYKYAEDESKINAELLLQATSKLILILAPFAPHFAEELWEKTGKPYSVFNQRFPKYSEDALKKDTINMAFQVNGKVRQTFDINSDATREEIDKYVRGNEDFKQYLGGKEIRKVIIVPGRLVNVVVA